MNKCRFQMRCWCMMGDILRTSPRPSTMDRADRQKWAGASTALAKLNEGFEQPRGDTTKKCNLSRGTRNPSTYIEMLRARRKRVSAGVVCRATLHCGVSRLQQLSQFMTSTAKPQECSLRERSADADESEGFCRTDHTRACMPPHLRRWFEVQRNYRGGTSTPHKQNHTVSLRIRMRETHHHRHESCNPLLASSADIAYMFSVTASCL